MKSETSEFPTLNMQIKKKNHANVKLSSMDTFKTLSA